MAKSKLQVASRKRGLSASQAKQRLVASEKIAHRIEWWRRRLAPQLHHIDPHDLDLIIAAMLRKPKERMQFMFLKRREDGSYVF
jgi:hypothetical protein